MVLTDFFELKGYSCKGIKNGTQALDHLKRIKPKIILLDIILPDIDGYEICKRIKLQKHFTKRAQELLPKRIKEYILKWDSK